ncbi:hypothetical protein DV736_g1070, partial [Chaetothyriales sp. CBS 134916]
MPTAYRFELSPNKRAGCQNIACKHEKVKIEKGELRFGNWVEIPNYPAGWKWKHWGCVTPLQITNLQNMLGSIDYDNNKDMDALDGWDELDDESRARIRQALKDGHIPDDDWRGDPELNRPGKRGINKPTPRKSARSGDTEDADEPASPTTTKAKTKKSDPKKVKAEGDGDASEAEPAPKSRKSKVAAKVKAEPVAAAEEEKAKRSRKRKVIIGADNDEGAAAAADAEPKSKRTKASRKKRVDAEPQPEAWPEPEVKTETKPKKSRKKVTKGKKIVVTSSSRAKRNVKTEPPCDDEAAQDLAEEDNAAVVKGEADEDVEVKGEPFQPVLKVQKKGKKGKKAMANRTALE